MNCEYEEYKNKWKKNQMHKNKTMFSEMGNCIMKDKFVVKNETEFNIFFQVTEQKLDLDIADIRPGKRVNTRLPWAVPQPLF